MSTPSDPAPAGRYRVLFAAGAAIETSVLPYHLIRLTSLFPEIIPTLALSPQAEAFLGPATVRALSSDEPHLTGASFAADGSALHLRARDIDALIVYPATPRLITEIASGTITCPVTRAAAFAPTDRMIVTPYVHPDLDARFYLPAIHRLEALGVRVVLPPSGDIHWTDASAWSATVTELGRLLPLGQPASIDHTRSVGESS